MDKQTQSTLFSSASGEYMTPSWLFEPVRDRLALNFDAAASQEMHLCPEYATIDGIYVQHFSTPHRRPIDANGLTGSWLGKRVWCNPPYGRGIDAWVHKAAVETQHGVCPVATLLLPARTDTAWFQQWVFPYAELHFLAGRVAFLGHYTKCFEVLVIPEDMGYPYTIACDPDHPIHELASSPFPSVIAVYQQGLAPRSFACDIKSAGEFTGGLPL